MTAQVFKDKRHIQQLIVMTFLLLEIVGNGSHIPEVGGV